MHHSDSLIERIQDGVYHGSVIGVGLTVFASTIYALVGPQVWEDSAPASLLAFVTLYLACGAVIGGTWGAIQPLRRTFYGTVAGFAIVIASAIGTLFWVIGGNGRHQVDLEFLAFIMVMGGGILGPIAGAYDWGRRTGKHWAEPYLMVILILAAFVKAGGADLLANVPGASWKAAAANVWPVILGGTIILAIRVWQRGREEM
ncbi:MAG TPA: hypothetical protein VFI39_00765 [Gemmatimonadales bacterium]|nr:hypothetical protein [Gemmatimonadales bacterium]